MNYIINTKIGSIINLLVNGRQPTHVTRTLSLAQWYGPMKINVILIQNGQRQWQTGKYA